MAPLALAQSKPDAAQPRIAIVGGGIAGLTAAWHLKRAGIGSTIYEASNRTCGRMYSATGVAAEGVTTELGGEFIDSSHKEILGFARRFGLGLIDTEARSERGLKEAAFLFGGEERSPAELASEFRALSPALARDVRAANNPGWEKFDRLTLAEYLDSIGLKTGWLRAALDVAFRTEYGMDIDEQSAMNLLSLIDPKVRGERIHFFGESDERYKIQGGNQKVADAVASEVRDQIQLGMQLEAIAERGEGYRLTIQKSGSGVAEVDADIVVLTLPFTILRRLDLRLPLPQAKRRAIDELGYGTNAKLFFGFERRLWRERGYAGAIFTDTDCQLVWDSSRLQPTTRGALTMLTGGKAGVAIGTGTPAEHEQRLLPHVEKVWAGVSALRTGAPGRFHWPSHKYTLGAYACYRAGQWTSIRGNEGTAIGRIFFAGEHCSQENQGYMEGGAETGKNAAAAIARMVKSR
ncbi:MAG: NAD(P)/FAD-dependent oxidoreductase [Bryobacter sp.]|jgi:monoamine oxidase|nr:NAD(P)/FAD-dependent oxidoreductase [Bryobacter sp.]